MRHNWAFTAVFLLLLAGCQKEEGVTVDNYTIQEELVPYFDRFQEEGAARGVTVDFVAAQLSAVLDDIAEPNVSGQCYYNGGDPNRLVIDRAFWSQASDIKREFVIFHELGHCYLGRSHLDTANPDGTCVSMMHSGLSGCRNAYNSWTRSAYLDELFLEN
ncbi:MAG: hypothetical protein R2824_19250 [Saprospiraceae bacterium]|nr:hypothetical protein [Lewinella sp.]